MIAKGTVPFIKSIERMLHDDVYVIGRQLK